MYLILLFILHISSSCANPKYVSKFLFQSVLKKFIFISASRLQRSNYVVHYLVLTELKKKASLFVEASVVKDLCQLSLKPEGIRHRRNIFLLEIVEIDIFSQRSVSFAERRINCQPF